MEPNATMVWSLPQRLLCLSAFSFAVSRARSCPVFRAAAASSFSVFRAAAASSLSIFRAAAIVSADSAALAALIASLRTLLVELDRELQELLQGAVHLVDVRVVAIDARVSSAAVIGALLVRSGHVHSSMSTGVVT